MIYNSFKSKTFKREKKIFYTQQEAPRDIPVLESEKSTTQRNKKVESKMSIKTLLTVKTRSLKRQLNRKESADQRINKAESKIPVKTPLKIKTRSIKRQKDHQTKTGKELKYQHQIKCLVDYQLAQHNYRLEATHINLKVRLDNYYIRHIAQRN